ncbi:hypothetical protein ACJX0J_005698, partial [Zea mays]
DPGLPLGEDCVRQGGQRLMELHGRWVLREGEMRLAQELFDEMPQKDTFSWGSLIDVYTECDLRNIFEALEYFQSMPGCGVRPDKVVAVGAVSASAQLGALEQVRWLHSCLEKCYLMMWSGCLEAEKVAVDDLSVLVILIACTHAGLISEGLEIFHRMKNDFGIDPEVEL